MSDKKYTDDTLEYYGLTKEDIEEIKKDDEVDGDIVLLEARIRVLLEEKWYTTDKRSIQSFLSKIKKSNVLHKI